MTSFNLRSYVVKETSVGIVINVLVATVPGLILSSPSTGTTLRSVREAAVSLTPQFFMAAFMSALVPSLLTCWRHRRGKLGIPYQGRSVRPDRAAVIAAGLAMASTILGLAVIHVVLAPLATDGMGEAAILVLGGAQAALAAATVTPLAILILLRRSRHAQPSVVVIGIDPPRTVSLTPPPDSNHHSS